MKQDILPGEEFPGMADHGGNQTRKHKVESNQVSTEPHNPLVDCHSDHTDNDKDPELHRFARQALGVEDPGHAKNVVQDQPKGVADESRNEVVDTGILGQYEQRRRINQKADSRDTKVTEKLDNEVISFFQDKIY